MSRRHRSGPSDRSFGLTVGGVFLGMGLLLLWRRPGLLGQALAGAGAVLMAAGALAPSALRGVHRGWMRVGGALGWFNARVLLTLMFVFVLTPTGLVLRALGRNPLRIRARGTGWRDADASRRGPDHFRRLY